MTGFIISQHVSFYYLINQVLGPSIIPLALTLVEVQMDWQKGLIDQESVMN